jgi:hypothetical protein
MPERCGISYVNFFKKILLGPRIKFKTKNWNIYASSYY